MSKKESIEKEPLLELKEQKEKSQSSKDVKSPDEIKDTKENNQPIISKSNNIHIENFINEASKLKFYPVETKENYQGNYDKYLELTLNHIAQMKNLNFAHALEDPSLYENLMSPNYSEKSDVPELDPATQKMASSSTDSLHSKKKILLLDLDETLIHSDFKEEYVNDKSIKYSTIITFKSLNENRFNSFETDLDTIDDESEIDPVNNSQIYENISVGVFIRNGTQKFLSEASKYFDVGIFTASVKEYADAVIDFLDPEKKIIKYRLYRNNCLNINNLFSVKDLRVFNKNIDLKNIVLVDNSMYSFSAQLTNGILINSFFNDDKDMELFNVLDYLINFILPAKDVREINEQFFNFQKITNELIHQMN